MKIPISKYISYYSKKRKAFVPGCIPRQTEFFKEMESIKNGYYEDLVGQVREIKDKKEKEEFKAKNLPALTVSATCKKWRLQENMGKYSGILGIDIDQHMNPHIKDWEAERNRFGNKKSIISSFLSVSGKGLYFTVRSTLETHKELFDYILWELERTSNIIGDVSGSDYLRLRFISHDPGLILKTDIESVPFINPTPEYYEWRTKQEEERKKLSAEIMAEYKDRLAEGGDDALEGIFKKFISVQETKGRHFVVGNRHNTLVAIAGMCVRYGIPEQVSLQLMRQHFAGIEGCDEEGCDFAVHAVYKTYKK